MTKKNTITAKKTTEKKTNSKLKTTKLITLETMACKGHFLPCPKCFDCQFSAPCFQLMQANTKEKAVQNNTKKDKKKKKFNNNTIAFLSLFSGDYHAVQNIGDICKSFTDIAKILGVKHAPKGVLQSLNTMLADHTNNKHLRDSMFFLATDKNYGVAVKSNNYHVSDYLY